MKGIIAFCLFFAAAFAFPSKPKLRPIIPTRNENSLLVVGGDEAKPHSRPFQVSLQAPVSGGWAHFCGGSIIGPNKVVTAAHCIDTGLSIPTLRVAAGEHNIYSPEGTEQYAMWKSAVWHPKWDYETIDWDYGVITVATNFKFNEYVQPIYLADNDVVPSGNCTASGWGYTSPGGGVPSSLQRIELPIVPRDDCQKVYNPINWPITERVICAGGQRDRSICDGDSGGPLTCTGLRGEYLAGINSYVMPDCGKNNYPDGFENVALGRDWLLSV